MQSCRLCRQWGLDLDLSFQQTQLGQQGEQEGQPHAEPETAQEECIIENQKGKYRLVKLALFIKQARRFCGIALWKDPDLDDMIKIIGYF